MFHRRFDCNLTSLTINRCSMSIQRETGRFSCRSFHFVCNFHFDCNPSVQDHPDHRSLNSQPRLNFNNHFIYCQMFVKTSPVFDILPSRVFPETVVLVSRYTIVVSYLFGIKFLLLLLLQFEKSVDDTWFVIPRL